MKKIIILLFICSINYEVKCQTWPTTYYQNFDGNIVVSDSLDISICDTNNINCKWQIGKPQKTIFNSANSVPNAIITDTINMLPPNDTAIFYLSIPYDTTLHIFGNYRLVLSFLFKLDGDSSDYGILEVSPDSGLHWVNMLTQDTLYHFEFPNGKPNFRGSTNGWESFNIENYAWINSLLSDTTILPITSNKLIFKFTYITDSNSVGREGWMIDDINCGYAFLGGLEDYQNNELISVYPNPVAEKLYINALVNDAVAKVQFFNIQGQLVFENNNFDNKFIDLKNIPNGIYYLKYKNRTSFAIKKIVIQH